MISVPYVERVIRGDDGKIWREHWEPIIVGSPPAAMVLIMRDPKSRDIVRRDGFWLKSREEVMG